MEGEDWEDCVVEGGEGGVAAVINIVLTILPRQNITHHSLTHS